MTDGRTLKDQVEELRAELAELREKYERLADSTWGRHVRPVVAKEGD